jgi:DNA topoisomerase-3
MRLVIAEKPSLAKAISDVLPAGTDIRVTHCYGHMLELVEPSAYNKAWAKWNLADLPIQVSAWKLAPKPAAIKQLAVIKAMMGNCSEIIHAGDPDREGQLLVDEILDHYGWKGPVKRLLINAADPASVKKALSRIEDNSKYQGLRHSAECRQRADWLVGMNLTRAITKLLSPDILVSIGRVQTPTLALVVRRHLAIKGFVSEAFYTLRGRFALAGGREIELKCEPDPRIKDEKQAKAIAAAIKGVTTPMVVQVTQQSRFSPLPYHLGDFQKAAERHFGWSISRSLEALQAAYEAKLTSYPRVDCRYLHGQGGSASRHRSHRPAAWQ